MTDYTFTTYIATAKERVGAEREIITDEEAAFARFRRQVAAIDPETPEDLASTSNGPQVPLADNYLATGEATVETVRDVYEDTVMATPHYDEEYGESFAKNVTVEFGADTATALTTGAPFTPELKQQVLNTANELHRYRRRFLDALDTEYDELRSAENALQSVEDTVYHVPWLAEYTIEDVVTATDRHVAPSLQYDVLTDARDALDEQVDRSEAVLAERQDHLRNREQPEFRLQNDNLNAYLYQDMDVTMPVLADVAEATRELGALQDQIDSRLYRLND